MPSRAARQHEPVAAPRRDAAGHQCAHESLQSGFRRHRAAPAQRPQAARSSRSRAQAPARRGDPRCSGKRSDGAPRCRPPNSAATSSCGRPSTTCTRYIASWRASANPPGPASRGAGRTARAPRRRDRCARRAAASSPDRQRHFWPMRTGELPPVELLLRPSLPHPLIWNIFLYHRSTEGDLDKSPQGSQIRLAPKVCRKRNGRLKAAAEAER